MRKILQKFNSLQLFFIIFFGSFFTFLIILSIPSLFDYKKLVDKIEKEVESDFGLNLSNISKINYRFVPSPHLVVDELELRLDSDQKNFIAKPRNTKIYIPFFNLYSNKKIQVNKIIMQNVNFNFDKESLNQFMNHMIKEKNKELVINKSKFFFTNKNNQVSTISILNKVSYFANVKSNQKKLKISGNLFDTDFNFNWNMDLNNPKLTSFALNFKKPNLSFENKLNTSNNENKIGNLKTIYLNNKIDTDYFYNKDRIKFESKKYKSEILSVNGNMYFNPFSINLNLDVRNQNIDYIINSILYNYYYNKDKIHKNLNGFVKINLSDIKNAYFNSGFLEFEISDTKLKILDNRLKIRNIGEINMIENFFYEQKGEIFFASLIQINVLNQKEFFRRFSIPIKNRKKITKLYLIFEKNIDKEFYTVADLSINQPSDFEFKLQNFDLLEKKSFDNFQKFRKIIKEEFVLKN